MGHAFFDCSNTKQSVWDYRAQTFPVSLDQGWWSSTEVISWKTGQKHDVFTLMLHGGRGAHHHLLPLNAVWNLYQKEIFWSHLITWEWSWRNWVRTWRSHFRCDRFFLCLGREDQSHLRKRCTVSEEFYLEGLFFIDIFFYFDLLSNYVGGNILCFYVKKQYFYDVLLWN